MRWENEIEYELTLELRSVLFFRLRFSGKNYSTVDKSQRVRNQPCNVYNAGLSKLWLPCFMVPGFENVEGDARNERFSPCLLFLSPLKNFWWMKTSETANRDVLEPSIFRRLSFSEKTLLSVG